MPRSLVTVFALAAIVAAPLVASAQESERWNGIMLNMNGPGPSAGNFQIEINEWNTDEQVQAYAQLLYDEGARRLEGELNQHNLGFIRMNSVGTQIGLARQIPQPDGGRMINLIAPNEVALLRGLSGPMARISDYAFGVIHLELDAEGNGSGWVIPAAELRFDSDGVLQIDSLGTPQIQLNEVEKQ